jgi:predicted nucleic acid-binding protein
VSSATYPSEFILDAWPILEWLKGLEPARSAFHRIAEDALAGRVRLSTSRINHGEVIYSIRKDFPADKVTAALIAFGEIPIQLYSVDDALIDEAVELKSAYPISYADAFGVALSTRLKMPFLSGDPQLRRISRLDFHLHWVGK